MADFNGIQEVIDVVATARQMTRSELFGSNTVPAVVRAREELYAVIRERLPGAGYAAIGAACGGKDHSTVRKALARHSERMAVSGVYRARFRTLCERVDRVVNAAPVPRPVDPVELARRATCRPGEITPQEVRILGTCLLLVENILTAPPLNDAEARLASAAVLDPSRDLPSRDLRETRDA
ncbi:hypothetical protein RHVG_00012 [Rhodovulum phage RS1]|uniref:hypothetical protein n=1 Tax=Rhodobacter phage RC1 TaxID=754055 RepID=UPI0002C17FD6|nr:hypothetical protein RHWG_00044 [Rhodobacter phage RC1]YP_007676391.1 hypothetical protein RHVG_00012 [Rhodovulum phage RS1]AGH57977.1 hypothetical protein RHVG_00012 [Rhodovulum phage RS1]AGH58065.1 hypothetical protein RHWG_00044 [Rhodobacter phage RC1]